MEKIRKEGQGLGTEIVKVDGFLNHQIDVAFIEEIGKEFHRRFSGLRINKILTVEASGIVGSFNGAKAREVQISDLSSLEQFLENLRNK